MSATDTAGDGAWDGRRGGAQPGLRQRVLVTGASRESGIGAAVAAAHAARGAAVAVHCRADTAAGEAVVAKLPGEGHLTVTGDLADPGQVARVVGEAVEGLGGIDVLVNNSGIYIEHPIAGTSYEEWQSLWRRHIDVNLIAAANTSWCVVDHLLHRPQGPAGGRIVMIGSRGGYRGEPHVPAYGASKAGLHSLAQSLAVALAPHRIAVAALAVGFTRTDLTADLLEDPEASRAVLAQHPLGRVADPSEIASAVAWFTSPEAEWATGAVLHLNGASYLH
ncbi:SDR family oxidoreductase [Streptomyces sp. MST-110588]|uniref:SDR family NAD(P)-dependent oxidoreductase n=1 Tax=Streptomyces sp. MST-110588 TaxID=2833628 RepID=UPI001F5DCDFA|nr:SDR family oxidoreductase [Streptomyces sp. MST-110588]UNO42702.1 SDR family oxidoreductase [Streptomyces sp. MST-110588]